MCLFVWSFIVILIIWSVQKSHSLTFTFLGHSFKNWYHIYQIPVFWDRHLDSRAHRRSELAATLVSAVRPDDCFHPVFRFILQLSSLTPGHQVISQLFFLGRNAANARDRQGFPTQLCSPLPAVGIRTCPCPACRNCASLLGCLMPQLLLDLLWDQDRGWDRQPGPCLVPGSRINLSKKKLVFSRCRFQHFPASDSRGSVCFVFVHPSHHATPAFHISAACDISGW